MRTAAFYNDIKDSIRPGDLIAFGGNSLFSKWAKLTTRSNVTHVGAVTHCHTCPNTNNLLHHDVFEATVRNKKRGVMITPLHERLDEYEGDIWWLPLHRSPRSRFLNALHTMQDFIDSESGRNYDIWQLFASTVDFFDNHPWLWRLTRNLKCEHEWFCSELIAELYNRTGVIKQVCAAETTPIDLCRFKIFQHGYVQLKGEEKEIRRFNSFLPDNWGQWLTEDDEHVDELIR
ncbi:hypothetical protein BFC18_20250 [Alteromonas confluentis]|uniref:Permuted papain-like amidase YaeF/Yiix C92 family enzyme n=2 Tax=Alteromonas confluentis TaxID=1656094 RepID=A0A1E7Z685_9ALTE|nr:hypothetical protein BFC18_20250 [Alteromonas confluentis]